MKKIFDFDNNKFYSILEAIEIVKKHSVTKFVSSIDIAIKLNLDTAKTEQQLRGTLSLPYFFGKRKKILVLDSNLTKNDAKSLDVDFTGGKEVIDEISKGWLAFDLIITTPKMMPELSKLGKVLGTRGLMPSPKNGNVTTNLKKTIDDFKSGLSQYRTDSYGNIHMLIGKTNAESKKIEENINFILDFLKSKKPSVVKGIYMQNVSISSTMGPGVKINIQKNMEFDKKSKHKSKTKTLTKKRVIMPITKVVYEKKTIKDKPTISKPIVVKNQQVVTSSKTTKPVEKKEVIKKPIVSNKISKPTISKPIVVKRQQVVTNSKATKPIVKKEIIKKLIVLNKTSKGIDAKKQVAINSKVAKSIEKIKVDKIDTNKVQGNRKITKTEIKKENILKKITPRKIEIKK